MAWTLLLLSGDSRGRLGNRPQVHLRLHQTVAKRWDHPGDDPEHVPAGLGRATLPIGTAYAVWTGIGAVGTAALGVYLFGEAATPARLAGVGLIVAGVALLKGAS